VIGRVCRMNQLEESPVYLLGTLVLQWCHEDLGGRVGASQSMGGKDDFFCSIIVLRRFVLLEVRLGGPLAGGFFSMEEAQLTTIVNIKMQT